jgi:hypothetical protein
MPSYSACEFVPSSAYMADGEGFRISVVDFDSSAPPFVKDTFDFPTYIPWPSNTNTAAVEEGYYSSGYDTTPSADQEPRYIAPSAFENPPLTVFAQPPPSTKTNDPSYGYFAGRLDASSTVAEQSEGHFDAEENFGKFQILMEDANAQPTPSTVIQETDEKNEPDVGDDDDNDDDEPQKSRPSRKTSKKDSTPTGQGKGGNNPFGSKGTRTCASCRKRKGKVLHLY